MSPESKAVLTAADVDLSVDLGGVRLSNPILSASGTFGHGLEMQNFVGITTMGAWVSKTVTLEPRHGNPAPRIVETEAGFLNSIGLENKGVESYEREVLPTFEGSGATVVTNIGGKRLEDFVAMAERLDKSLSACQLGITMASLALGWVGEPAFAVLVGPVHR